MKNAIPNTGLRLLLILASVVIIFAGIKASSQLIAPILLASFLSIVLYPLVSIAAKYRIPSAVTITFIMLAIIISFFVISTTLVSSLNDFARSLINSRGLILEKLRSLRDYTEVFGFTFSIEELVQYLDPSALINVVTRFLSGFSGMMTSIFLLMMTIFFMLFEVNSLPGKLQQAMTDPTRGMESIRLALQKISHYVAIKTVISIITGIAVWIFLSIIGVRFAILWGLLAFLLNYIPNIGSIIAAIGPIVQALLFNGFSDSLIVMAGFVVINVVFGNILEPRVMGKGLGLSTLVVFLSLLTWGWLLGPIGMLLSIPLTIVIKIILEHSPEGKKIAIMLGDGKS